MQKHYHKNTVVVQIKLEFMDSIKIVLILKSLFKKRFCRHCLVFIASVAILYLWYFPAVFVFLLSLWTGDTVSTRAPLITDLKIWIQIAAELCV